MEVPQTVSITAAYYPAIPLLGIDLGKPISQRDTGTPMITAVLFTIAKTWKQPKCPLTKEEVKNMMQCYSATKRTK